MGRSYIRCVLLCNVVRETATQCISTVAFTQGAAQQRATQRECERRTIFSLLVVNDERTKSVYS